MWNKCCYLGKDEITKNEVGEPVRKIKFEKDYIFCSKKSIRASEFYLAQNTTLRPELTLEVRTIDVEDFLNDGDSVYVQYEDHEYTVIRTYCKSEDITELILQRGIDNVNA